MISRDPKPPTRSAGESCRDWSSSCRCGPAAEAEITPGEANDLASLVQAFVNSLQGNEFDQRLRFVEERRNDAIRQM